MRFQGAHSLLNTSLTTFVSVMTVQTSFGRRSPAATFRLALLLFLLPAEGVHAQDRAGLRVDENLRAEPQGVIIGRLPAGSSISVVSVQGSWVQVDLRGWIWTPSIRVTDRGSFDLTVSASPNENLRAEPSGTIIAVLEEGALLNELEESQGWTRVRRVAWVWGPSMDLSGDAAPAPPSTSSRSDQGSSGEGWWRPGSGGMPILTGPDGDTLAQAKPGSELQILAREGNWVRVRLEGWSWAPEGSEPDSVGEGIVSEATPEEVMQDPERYRGQVVSWELLFVSREEAERVRTDFFEGEPFLLTRTTSSDRAYVYVAIPPERRTEVEGLIPLERIRVVGRIRTGATAFTGSPILDLLELTRISGY